MSSRPLLITISGLPLAGKSYLASLIADRLSIPLIVRDEISETLFDSFKLLPDQWADEHRKATYELTFLMALMSLRAGKPIIIDSTFNFESSAPRFEKLAAKCNFRSVQIVVTAEKEALLKRYKDRIGDPEANGKTHPIHFSHLTFERFKQKLEDGAWHTGAFDLGGEVWKIDTTEFGGVDYEQILTKLSYELAEDT